MTRVKEKFRPEAVVCQCGADGIAGDPMESFNLTPLGLGRCVYTLQSWKIPLLLLGGGKYYDTGFYGNIQVGHPEKCYRGSLAGKLGFNSQCEDVMLLEYSLLSPMSIVDSSDGWHLLSSLHCETYVPK